MKCGQAEKWMDAALDELSGGAEFIPAGWTVQRRAELEVHLAGCPACRGQWDVLRSAEAVLRVPKPVPAPESLLADFRQRLAAEERRETRAVPPVPRRGAGWRWLWPLGSLAAAGAAAATVFMFNVQAPVSSIQEIRGARTRSYVTVPSPTPAAPVPRGDDRTVAGSRLAAPLAKAKPSLDVRGRPEPEQMAAVPTYDMATREIVPSLPERLSQRAPATKSLTELRRAETEARDLDRVTSADTQVKEALRKDVPAAEQESGPQLAPVRTESLNRGKQLAAKEQLEVSDKLSLMYARSRGETSNGQQKQFGAVASNSAQITSNIRQQQSQSVTLSMSSNASQPAQSNDFYYAQVPAEPTPVELSVSAAVLNALQRPVELHTSNVRVQDLALQLSTEADVEVKVDPQVGRLNVTLEEAGVPLWRVLEDVARQTQMEIYPSENTLLLRPSKSFGLALSQGVGEKAEAKQDPAAKSKKEATFRSRGVQADSKLPAEAPAASPAPSGPAGPAGVGGGGFGGGRASAGGIGRPKPGMSPRAGLPAPAGSPRYAYSNRQPDRKFWPAAWGNLPERGFEVPNAQELPPLILAPVQLGKALSNEVPQVRLRRTVPAKPATKKPRPSR